MARGVVAMTGRRRGKPSRENVSVAGKSPGTSPPGTSSIGKSLAKRGEPVGRISQRNSRQREAPENPEEDEEVAGTLGKKTRGNFGENGGKREGMQRLAGESWERVSPEVSPEVSTEVIPGVIPGVILDVPAKPPAKDPRRTPGKPDGDAPLRPAGVVPPGKPRQTRGGGVGGIIGGVGIPAVVGVPAGNEAAVPGDAARGIPGRPNGKTLGRRDLNAGGRWLLGNADPVGIRLSGGGGGGGGGGGDNDHGDISRIPSEKTPGKLDGKVSGRRGGRRRGGGGGGGGGSGNAGNVSYGNVYDEALGKAAIVTDVELGTAGQLGDSRVGSPGRACADPASSPAFRRELRSLPGAGARGRAGAGAGETRRHEGEKETQLEGRDVAEMRRQVGDTGETRRHGGDTDTRLHLRDTGETRRHPEDTAETRLRGGDTEETRGRRGWRKRHGESRTYAVSGLFDGLSHIYSTQDGERRKKFRPNYSLQATRGAVFLHPGPHHDPMAMCPSAATFPEKNGDGGDELKTDLISSASDSASSHTGACRGSGVKVSSEDLEMFQAAQQRAGERLCLRVDSLCPAVIEMGRYEIQTLYHSALPANLAQCVRLFVCEFCLCFLCSRGSLQRHSSKCRLSQPPAPEIYRDGTLSVYEVDGGVRAPYCRNLCLLAMLFLPHKTLCVDVHLFLFYVVTRHDHHGSHLVAYFSKEKQAKQGHNLSCILTLPQYQRLGYGHFLISLSYLLSRREGRPGSPEKPLSDLGRVAYASYWREALTEALLSWPLGPAAPSQPRPPCPGDPRAEGVAGPAGPRVPGRAGEGQGPKDCAGPEDEGCSGDRQGEGIAAGPERRNIPGEGEARERDARPRRSVRPGRGLVGEERASRGGTGPRDWDVPGDGQAAGADGAGRPPRGPGTSGEAQAVGAAGTRPEVSVVALSRSTGMTPEDVVATLRSLGSLRVHNGRIAILHPHWRRAAGHLTRPSANRCARIRLDESRLRWEPRPLVGTNRNVSPGSRDRGAGGEVHRGSPSPPPPVLIREEPQCIVGARRKRGRPRRKGLLSWPPHSPPSDSAPPPLEGPHHPAHPYADATAFLVDVDAGGGAGGDEGGGCIPPPAKRRRRHAQTQAKVPHVAHSHWGGKSC